MGRRCVAGWGVVVGGWWGPLVWIALVIVVGQIRIRGWEERKRGGGYFLCFLTLSLTCNDENPAPFSSRAFSLPFVNFAVA